MDQTTSRPMPVATTLPAARDVQAMQQRRRLEGGRWQFNGKFLAFLLSLACDSFQVQFVRGIFSVELAPWAAAGATGEAATPPRAVAVPACST